MTKPPVRAASFSMQAQTYTRTAVVLHWLIALCVLVQITFGLWMIGIPKSPPGVRAYWFNVHKSIGITLGMLILVRVFWRLAHRAPALLSTLVGWQRFAAKANHFLLYLCMLIMPVSGYLGSSFTKYPILYFGMKLPHWGWDAPALKDLCSQIHLTTVITFMLLIAVHVAAALRHLLIKRDGTFERMWHWPRRSR
jgi:cytochrome b561